MNYIYLFCSVYAHVCYVAYVYCTVLYSTYYNPIMNKGGKVKIFTSSSREIRSKRQGTTVCMVLYVSPWLKSVNRANGFNNS